MRFERSFRFADEHLNGLLLRLVGRAGIAYGVDEHHTVYYRKRDEERFEDILADVRAEAFDSWQVLSSPEDWIPKYRDEIARRKIPCYEEVNNGRIEFLLPGRARPHSWQMA